MNTATSSSSTPCTRPVIRPGFLIAAVGVLLVGISVSLLAYFRATLTPPIVALPKPIKAEQKSNARKAARGLRVDVRLAGTASPGALSAVNQGRLLVTTLLADADETEGFVAALIARGGLIILSGTDGKYWLKDSGRGWVAAGELGERLCEYALDRARQLSADSAVQAVGNTPVFWRHAFVIMPKEFEARLAGSIAEGVQCPIDDIAAATVTARVGATGYLSFAVNRVDFNSGRQAMPGFTIRGL